MTTPFEDLIRATLSDLAEEAPRVQDQLTPAERRFRNRRRTTLTVGAAGVMAAVLIGAPIALAAGGGDAPRPAAPPAPAGTTAPPSPAGPTVVPSPSGTATAMPSPPGDPAPSPSATQPGRPSRPGGPVPSPSGPGDPTAVPSPSGPGEPWPTPTPTPRG
ncbi:hypothetical protein ABZ744_15315 [Micromonospora chersina]|uniref:hypothetical protein n=1 Tax=Micromonospora chersina TaxID=47854 RepID=UPI0033E39DFB